MGRRRIQITGILAAVAMASMILDPKTALLGAGAGVELCMKTVIPSLFPFFILSVLLTESLIGTKSRVLGILGTWCSIPAGAESILLVGFLGGYPVGAQCVCQAYASGRLDRYHARRMMGFCSNAGPAFIFGMVACLFGSRSVAFILWLIHILSALLVGVLLPGKDKSSCRISQKGSMSIGQAMEQSIRVMAGVCGWVVVFRVILAFFDRWFLWVLDPIWKVCFGGILELANGCFDLNVVQNEGLRFILSSIFLAFGGICVGMQTASVTARAGLDTGLYFPGKILQAAIGGLLACPAAILLYPETAVDIRFPVVLATVGALVLLILKKEKINSSIPALSGV